MLNHQLLLDLSSYSLVNGLTYREFCEFALTLIWTCWMTAFLWLVYYRRLKSSELIYLWMLQSLTVLGSSLIKLIFLELSETLTCTIWFCSLTHWTINFPIHSGFSRMEIYFRKVLFIGSQWWFSICIFVDWTTRFCIRFIWINWMESFGCYTLIKS